MQRYLSPRDLEALHKFSRLFSSSDEWHIKREPSSRNFAERARFSARYLDEPRPGSSASRTPLHAALGAMGEAIERFCIARSQADLLQKTARELRGEGLSCLDPSELRIYSAAQKAFQAGQAIELKPDTRVDWSWFERGATGGTADRVLIPAQTDLFFKAEIPIYYAGSSSGCACGITAESAKLRAILELIERDAVMFYWLTRNAPVEIRAQSFDHRLSALKRKLRVFSLPMDHGIPVILVAFQGNGGSREPRFAVTAAADLLPARAIERAISEMAQSLAIIDETFDDLPRFASRADFEETIWHFRDHVGLYAHGGPKNAYSFLFRPASVVSAAELKSLDLADEGENLKLVQSRLEKAGISAYFRDNTTCDVAWAGLRVFRAFSPQLIPLTAMHRFRPLGMPRLYALPKKLKLPSQPERAEDLNPYPHPFP